MNSPLHLPEDLLPLFDRVIAGELEERDRARLEEALRSSGELREAFRNYVAVHVELSGAVRLARGRQVVYEEIRLQGAGAAKSASRRGPVAGVERRPASVKASRNMLGWPGLGMILAACVALAFILQPADKPVAQAPPATPVPSSGQTSNPPAPVATLAASADAKWKRVALLQGHTFREGDIVELEAGEAQFSVGCGAEVVAVGPCTLAFESRDRLRLIQGELAAHVAEWAEGFTVATRSMEVVDLGTTFTVSSSADKGDETRVLNGLVRVHPVVAGEQQSRGLIVSEGEALAVDRRGKRTKRKAAGRKWPAFPGLTDVTPYCPIHLPNTGHGLSVGDEDPNWKVVSGPEGFGGEQYASVCKPHYRYLRNDPKSSQWVSRANWTKSPVDAVYTFRTQFEVNGYELDTIKLFGRLLADNGVQEVRVNGKPVDVQAWVDSKQGVNFNNNKFRFVEVTDVLVPGDNVIEVDVYNAPYPSELKVSERRTNHMALRVEWYAFGRKPVIAAKQDKDQRTPEGPQGA